MVVILLMGACLLPAQISNFYAFSATTETYAAITGTNVPTAIGDNVISNPIDIGFTFAYGLNSYTQIKISSNGYLTLGTGPGSVTNNALGSSTCPVLAPLWDDTYLQGSAQYLLQGSAPNRVLTVQYTGVKWPTNSVTSFSYQVKMYEDSTIEFIYGPGVGMPMNASASIGINMLPGGYNNFCSVTPGNPGSASYTVENSSISMWPGTNTKYTFSGPDQFANDLAALSITGNQTPTAEVSYEYSVAVLNNGTETQTGYNVSIMSGDTELASVVGPEIAPLSSINVAIPWTPATPGALDITGKVGLANDEDSSNDTTEPLSLIVQPAGITALTIGDGSQLARKPVDVSYRNSMFQTIFPASEITYNGNLSGVSFYSDFVDTCTSIHTKIWLGTTTQTNLSAGWIPAYQLVQVFNGYINYPAGQNTINITFNTATPFTYTGGNLVMLVNRPMDTEYYSFNNKFLCQTVGTNRSRMAYSDASTFDPNNMGTMGAVSGQFPKTTLYMQSTTGDPAFSVDPQSHNFGQVIINQSASQVFSVYNSGGGILNISDIEIGGSPFFNIQNLPTLPIVLGSGQSTTFTVQYLPTAAGNHSGTISITDDLNRLTHTVALSGSCIDPTITTIPYTQNFDAVTVPNLPLGWQKLVTGTGSVNTVTSTSYSAPNSVMMNNSNSPLGPFLISPPLSTALQVNTLKLRFRAKGTSAYSLSVGIMSNPLDADTYTEIQTLSLSSVWTDYYVDLRSYTGTGNQIAIKHAQGGNNRSIYVDNIRIESLLQDDLAALSIVGNTTPNVGAISNYTIEVFNWGLNAQDDYQVKLFKQGEIELASTTGPPIAGNSQALVTIPWEPSQVENTFLYAKIVLADDEDISNNQTQNLNITVQASETTLVVVGVGNQFDNTAPVDMAELNSLYENIYTQDELTSAGLISIVEFYNFFSNNILNKPTKIWLGMTEQMNLNEGWVPSNQLSLVFDGNVDYPSGSNTISIILQEPFTLAPGYNLVMLVQRPMDTTSYGYWESFISQTHPTNRSRIAADSALLDPENPPAGSYTGSFPQTGFYITPGTAGNLEGVVWNAENQPLANATVQILNGPHTVTNANGEYSFQNILASDYSVTASAHGYYDLTQYITVESEETAELDFSMTQRSTVTVTGTITGSDNTTAGLASATISLSGYEDYQAVTDDTGMFTFTGVYAEQTYEYEAEADGYQLQTGTVEIGNTDIELDDIVLNENTYMPGNVSASPINAHADVDVMWLAPNPENSERDLLGYKVWRLQPGQEEDETTWTALTPDPITALRYIDTAWDTLPQGTFKWAVKSIYTSNLVSDPAFSNNLQTTGMLSGFVYNEEMDPLINANVTVGSQSVTTQSDGSYSLHLPGGSYSVVCSLTGYYNNTQHDVEIVVGETTQLNFTLIPVSTTGTLLGVVKDNLLQPVMGATITVDTNTVTTVADGSYIISLPPGTYSVTCSHEDYFSETQENVVITLDQNTQLNFTMLPVSNEDNLQVAATKLNGNSPNPFNPNTTISYDIKDATLVSLAIYNIKGQLIRSLVNEAKSTGHYTVHWDGKDQQGKEVGSGVYQYVLKTGEYQETKRMTLLK
jgi:hypothetical protein